MVPVVQTAVSARSPVTRFPSPVPGACFDRSDSPRARSRGTVTGVVREVAELCHFHSVGSKVEQAYSRSVLFWRRRRVMEAWNAYVTGGGTDWEGIPSVLSPVFWPPETAPAAVLARSSLRKAAHLKRLLEVGDLPLPTGWLSFSLEVPESSIRGCGTSNVPASRRLAGGPSALRGVRSPAKPACRPTR